VEYVRGGRGFTAEGRIGILEAGLPDTRMPSPDRTDGPVVQKAQSFQRGIDVIRVFDGAHPRMTLSQVAKRTDLTRATARRFLYTLIDIGYMDTDGREFWLTPRVLELGFAYLSSLGIPEIATPHLQRLTQQVNESSSVSILDGADIVYVARVPMRRIMTVAISVGTRFPAYATSMGRVLLAGLESDALDRVLEMTSFIPLTPQTVTTPEELIRELDQVREQGWAFVDQELEMGLRSIAAPIFDAKGRVVAAANVSLGANRFGSDPVKDFLPALLDATGRISDDLKSAKLQQP
jgi:IclR family transcriptional regulator, pca regulon regulatory protein